MDDHNKLRKRLCLVCCDKADRTIPESLVPVIREFLVLGYQREYPRLPEGLCGTCRVAINSMKNRDFDVTLPEWFDYKTMANYHFPRDGSRCECVLCTKASSAHLFGQPSSKSKRPGRPKSTEKRTSRIIHLCGTCLAPTEDGLSHRCTKGQSGAKLAAKMISTCPKNTTKRLAYELIQSDLSGKPKHYNLEPKIPSNVLYLLQQTIQRICLLVARESEEGAKVEFDWCSEDQVKHKC